MASVDLRAFARANLPEPPARVLEVGAGAGSLARALRAAGYTVLAIDPRSENEDIRPVALADLDEPAGSFAAAVAIVSLHHVDPLEESCRRLGELVEAGGTLVVDEFDVGASTSPPQPGGSSSVPRSANRYRRPLKSSSKSIATTCTRSTRSSRRSSRTSRSACRCGGPGSTAGTSATRFAESRKTRSREASFQSSGHASWHAAAARKSDAVPVALQRSLR